jgi:protein gp37
MNPKNVAEWEDFSMGSWNPVTGCEHWSAGCDNCYARQITSRFHKEGRQKYENNFKCTLQPDLLKQPRLETNRSIFVCSMSDLFQNKVPDDFIISIFDCIKRWKGRHFHTITKRAERMAKLAPKLPWPENLWAGITIEHSDYLYRADLLRSFNPALRFIVAEPLLSSLRNLDLTGIGGLVVGGESEHGNNRGSLRAMKKAWVIELRDKCQAAKVPFFFKQWGEAFGNPDADYSKFRGGCVLDGKVYHERPPLIPPPAKSALIIESIFEDIEETGF